MKYCTKCGSKLDDATGLCPKCDKQPTKKELKAKQKIRRKSEKKAAKKEKWRRLPFTQKIKKIFLRILIAALIIAVVGGGVTGVLVYYDVIEVRVVSDMFKFFGLKKAKPETETKEVSEAKATDEPDDASYGQYTVKHPDADKYYQNNSDVLSTDKASESGTMMTEKEVYELMEKRGFKDFTVTTSYTANGEFIESKEISKSSSEKHPMYEAVYSFESGEIWSITIVNNSITAYPLRYNYQHNTNTKVMLAENDYMVSYDSKADKFYKTVPHNDILILKKIGQINESTLRGLDFGEIDKL